MSPSCRATLEDCVRALRTGREGTAGRQLAIFVDCIQGAFSAGELTADPRIHSELARALECQKRHDLIGLADIMEFELAPLLEPDGPTEN